MTRRRPPLNLSDPDPKTEPPAEAAPAPESAPESEPTPEPEPHRPPLSERRRRRLAEEQRQAAEAEAAARAAVEVQMAAADAGQTPVAVEEPAAPAQLPVVVERVKPEGGSAYLVAGLASALWVGALAAWFAYEFGAGVTELEPLRLAAMALVTLAPVGLALLLAQAVRQGGRLAAETKRARLLADAMAAPTALATRQSGELITSLRGDIDQASSAAERIRGEMEALRRALTEETARLNEAAEAATRTSHGLAERLGAERDAMAALGERLDAQSTGVAEAVERQSRMVVDASDLAQTQLREAEAALAARAADLAAAAGEAQDAARLAADDLSRQTLRLENAGSGVAEQIHAVEEGLGQQRAALVTAAYALRTDQEDFAAQLESQRAQLAESLSAARAAAASLGDTSEQGVQTLKDLVEAASDQFKALSDLSAREADSFDIATKQALDRFESIAAESRDVLAEETRRTLEALRATAEESRALAAEAADQAQIRADRLGEALFAAAQKADAAADARIDGARKVVIETAGLVDDAGKQTLERLEATIGRLFAALTEVDDAVAGVDERASRIPEEAKARIEDIRQTVESSLNSLADASKKAAEETEAVDAAFQERVKRNYDMLTEAVRLMGLVSGDANLAQPRRRDRPATQPLEPLPEPARTPTPAADQSGRGFGQRNRLRLAPAEDRPATQQPAQKLDWDDLMGGEPEEAPLTLERMAPDEGLSDRITAAIRRIGVDPNALLPRSRVEESALAFAGGDADRSRQIVRRVAPAAVRSISRRVLSDPDLKADAERYVKSFALSLHEAAHDGDDQGLLSQLSSDPGRAFLLLDAAIGDLR